MSEHPNTRPWRYLLRRLAAKLWGFELVKRRSSPPPTPTHQAFRKVWR